MPLYILIIGGSDAGISAALRAHELDASARIAVVLADAFPNFSICGLPFFLSTMDDSFRVYDHLTNKNPKSAVIVGAGYIGLEMADALVHRGLEVTLISRPSEVLTTVDPELGQLVRKELDRKGVRVLCGREIQTIDELQGGKLVVRDSNGFKAAADFVLIGVGVRPALDLAESASIKIGDQRAIRVNRAMETSVQDIYAAGDCVETWHRLLNKTTYMPLGTTSHKQGRVAGENAVGGNAHFAGSLGTQVVKVFELAIARTGLRDEEAWKAGFDPLTVQSAFWDHKAYYPGAQEIVFRICGDKSTGRLLGAQLIGHWKSEISKRVDIFATALFHNMTVENLNELDLSYTPPLSSPWDPVQMAAQAWCRSLNNFAASA